MTKRTKILLLTGVVVIVVIGAGVWWGQREVSYSGPIEPVTVRLKWLHQAQFAGTYMAQEPKFNMQDVYTTEFLK